MNSAIFMSYYKKLVHICNKKLAHGLVISDTNMYQKVSLKIDYPILHDNLNFPLTYLSFSAGKSILFGKTEFS